MFKVKTLNKISPLGLNKLPKDCYEVGDEVENPDGIILRSYSMHEMELPQNLLGIARAGAGTNNIPIDRCTEQGIVVFNAPGANANAVKELVIAAMLISSRDMVGAIDWTRTLKGDEDAAQKVEKGKSQFIGPEIMGKTLAVIGLGHIGVLIANAAVELGMDVVGYDPFLSVETALLLNPKVRRAESVEQAAKVADYVTIHVPYNNATHYILNGDVFAQMKGKVRVINLARGELVDNDAMKQAIAEGKVAYYITDFPTAEVLDMDKVIALPHIGASTPEAEENCAIMAANQLKDYLEYGNIKNSVNYPNCVLDYTPGLQRLSVAASENEQLLQDVTAIFAKHNALINNMVQKERKNNIYMLIDAKEISQAIVDEIKGLQGVKRVRIVY